MTDENNQKNGAENSQGTEEFNVGTMPDLPMMIHAQYIKDLSFENPGSPQSLRAGQAQPKMDININMDARKIEDKEIENLYEVALSLTAGAKREDDGKGQMVFMAEVVYAALVSLNNVEQEKHHPMLLIEVPRLIFPFARQVLSDVTQQGGYPPLMLNPVDFYGMYLNQFKEAYEGADKAGIDKAEADKEGAIKKA